MKEKKDIVIKKPSFFLYTLPTVLAGWFFRLKWNIHVDKKEYKKCKGPMVC